MATKTTKSTGLKYSDAVKAQGGSAINRQTGAVTTAPGYTAPKTVNRGSSSQPEYGFEGGSRAGNALPSAGDPAADVPMTTPTVAPIQQPPTPQPETITPQQGLTKALESGVQPPQDAGEARSQIQQYLPQESTTFYKPSANSQQVYDAQGNALSYDQYIAAGGKADFSNVRSGLPANAGVQQQLEADPGYQQLLQAQKEYNDVANQRTSLTKEYSKLSKKLGIDELNTELMNMKNVIEGTEDDLRVEITKAGGFATESQVQALTMARNKQLVKNYNNLLETKQMAMETLNTMIGLAAQDRQFAQQAALQKFQIETQVIEYKDKMRQNSANALFKIAEVYGYGAIASGDPWQDALTEKTLGLPQGGLAQLSNMKTLQQQQFEQQQLLQWSQFGLQQDQFGLEQQKFAWDMSPNNPANAPEGFTLGENQTRYDANGNPVAGAGVNAAAGDPIALESALGQINTINGLFNKVGNTGATVGVGTGSWRDFFVNPFSSQKGDFIAGVKQLTGQIVGKTLTDLKAQGATFGALSDAELQLLQNSAAKFSSWEVKDGKGNVVGYKTSPTSFKEELNRINNYAKLSYLRKGGSPGDIGIPKQPDGQYFLDINGRMLNVTPQQQQYGPAFNSAGTASSANQVKGSIPQRSSFMPQLNTGVEGKKVPLVQAYPQGSIGGQCGVWVRNIVQKQGLTYPPVGNSLTEKAATARRYGVPLSQAKQGSVLLTAENKTNGHVAYIVGRNAQGFILAESNYGLNGKVQYGRVIPYNSPKILGIINPTRG